MSFSFAFFSETNPSHECFEVRNVLFTLCAQKKQQQQQKNSFNNDTNHQLHSQNLKLKFEFSINMNGLIHRLKKRLVLVCCMYFWNNNIFMKDSKMPFFCFFKPSRDLTRLFALLLQMQFV